MICLSKRQILFLHEELIRETGGSPGLRDEDLLDSALAAPFQTFDGQPLYPSLQRIGAHAMLVFLALNGIELDYTQEELSAIILRIAAGEASSEELLDWLLNHEQN